MTSGKTRKTIALISAAAMCVSAFAACSDKNTGGEPVPSDTSAESSAETQSEAAADGINAMFGEIRTEFNDSLDLSDYPLTKSEVPADYSLTLEMETGEFLGGIRSNDLPEASGGAYVSGLNQEGDEVKVTAQVEYSGFYTLNFQTRGSAGRYNNVLVDGEKVGEILTLSEGIFGDTPVDYVYLEAGSHVISLTPSWGYIDIDCLILTPSDTINEDTYKVTKPLSNPNADDNAKRLYKFLCDVYGKYSLAGQYADEGRASSEYEKITAATGKTFAVLGLDVGNYSLGSKAHGAESRTVEYAYDWYKNAGGIVQLCWHWTTPEAYAVNAGNNPWYSSFYKEGSKLDLDKIMNGEDDEAYQLLMDDIDNMASELERLRDAGVPVLWRPLHEASGGWFWWGNCEAESYIKLWNVMYDKMTNEHDLTNLIWVWNGQDPAWYPGDETVDICGWDIYAGNHVDTSQSGRFADMAVNYGTEKKLIALTENGCVMDPDKVMRDNARWLFWGTWSDPFTMKLGVVINEEYTTKDLLIKAYNHDRVLTLDELPDLKNYPLD
ncbi:MAG: glycosyl hydrolase [Huintestinicola sp.]